MEQRRSSSSSLFSSVSSYCVLLLLIGCFLSSGSVVVVEGYKNYTVGDSLGWFDNSEKPDVNYQKWASNKVFSLGDFLIFNTDTNHTIVQTYNSTTYKLCNYEDAQDNDTFQWSSSNPSNTETQQVSVSVPLIKEGITYFFSSDYDGDQCKNGGQHFQINVIHGQGLPKSLKDPSEDAPSPSSSVSGDDESAPDTIVPANFNHPKNQSGDDSASDDEEDKGKSGSGSVSMCSQFSRKLCGFIVLLGLVFLL